MNVVNHIQGVCLDDSDLMNGFFLKNLLCINPSMTFSVCSFVLQASNHVNKYCRSELKGKESIVCSGHMTIHRNVEQD